MLVGFIGSPLSGKTTIAAQAFAELKKMGIPNVEFLSEQARQYIATAKYYFPYKNTLDDNDQTNIYCAQRKLEVVLSSSVGHHGVVVCDSLALNSLFYMSPMFREQFFHNYNIKDLIQFYSTQLIFKCAPVGFSTNDTLRLHNAQQSQEIEDKINSILTLPTFDPLTDRLELLVGPIDVRSNQVVEAIYERISQS